MSAYVWVSVGMFVCKRGFVWCVIHLLKFFFVCLSINTRFVCICVFGVFSEDLREEVSFYVTVKSYELFAH